MRVRHVFGALVALLLLGLASSLSADWRSDIEADWIVQEERKRAQATSTTATTEGDALGAIDGIKEGRWGFHAALEASPWWMVDLGEEIAIGRIVVYNRGGAGGRSVNMLLSTSLDGETWTQVHDCGGQAFGGTGAGEPLAVTLDAHNARFVKCHLPGSNYFHLDEVEVYASGDDETNVALWKTANQSSVSPWSVNHPRPGERVVDYLPVAQVIKRGDKLSADLAKMGVDTAEFDAGIARVTQELGDQEFGDEALYAKARWLVRDLALKNPLLDFDQIVFSKRKPTQYSHMSDQYYGWWSKPGGGLYTMSNYKSGAPELTCITDGWPEGTFLRPELSHDGSKILFAFCKYYLETSGNPNKVDKASIPEDAFYH
ncbi:MAG TPA: discoidin domain-containing protein, partial [Armatimonadota bacterium]|nr:discoidin domain-containing protein [Armatimonadota bacterium]